MLTLDEARDTHCCRICGKYINVPAGNPVGWQYDFGRMVFPVHLTLNFGKEFAHTDCLPEEPQP